MDQQEQLKKDLEVLKISEIEKLTIKFVTAKYRSLAKEKHPDRDGGNTGDFQVLQGAYKRVIRHLEEFENQEDEDEGQELQRSSRTPEYDILSSIRLANVPEKMARERGMVAGFTRNFMNGFDF